MMYPTPFRSDVGLTIMAIDERGVLAVKCSFEQESVIAHLPEAELMSMPESLGVVLDPARVTFDEWYDVVEFALLTWEYNTAPEV